MAAWDNPVANPFGQQQYAAPLLDFTQLGKIGQQPQQQQQRPGQPGQPMNIQPQQQNILAQRLAQLLGGSFGGQPGQGTQWGVPSVGNIGGTAGGPGGTLGSIY